MIEVIPVGPLGTNCYIVGDNSSGQGLIIDPGDEAEKIIFAVGEMGINVEYIINTHGHYDHIGANGKIKEKFGSDILIHGKDAHMLTDPALNLSFKKDRKEIEDPPADRILEEGDIVEVGSISLEVLHTPGHSPGSICLLTSKEIFTGDTLFSGSAGRTDLPGGSYEDLMDSIQQKIKPLPSNLAVYPGHGPHSTMESEKKQNPFLQQ